MSHLSMETLVALREPGTEPGEAAAREHLEAAPSAAPSSIACTSGWPGSRRCRRSARRGSAGRRS